MTGMINQCQKTHITIFILYNPHPNKYQMNILQLLQNVLLCLRFCPDTGQVVGHSSFRSEVKFRLTTITVLYPEEQQIQKKPTRILCIMHNLVDISSNYRIPAAVSLKDLLWITSTSWFWPSYTYAPSF